MMKYISHLDLLRLFQRACRRADLPLVFTEGFNPRPRIKIEPALKLGLESNDLRVEMILSGEVSPKDVEERLASELPDGVEIIEIKIKE